MAIEIDDTLTRRNNANFKLVDDNDIGGGMRVVADIPTRDSIPTSMLKGGMLVYVAAVDTYFKLLDDSPLTWTVFSTGGGGGVSAIAAGTGIVLTPDPIVATGIVSVNVAFSPTWTGAHTFNGVVAFGGASTITGNMIPTADNTQDIGSTAFRWRSVHVGPGSVVIHNDNTNTAKLTLDFFSATEAELVGSAGAALAPGLGLRITGGAGGAGGALGGAVTVTTGAGTGASASGNLSLQLGGGPAAGTLNIGTSTAVSVLTVGSSLVTSALYRGASVGVEAIGGNAYISSSTGTTSILAGGFTHLVASGTAPHLTIGPSNNIEISIVSPLQNGLDFVQGAPATIKIRQSTTLGTPGAVLSVFAGQGAHGSGATPGAGGGISVFAGGTGGNGTAIAAAGTGGQNTFIGGSAGTDLGGGGGIGGILEIDGGPGSGSAAHGSTFIGQTRSPFVQIGRIGGPSKTAIIATETWLTPLSLAASHPTNDILLQSPAHTSLAAGIEHTSILFGLNASLNFATGAITNQRHVRFTQPAYSFVAASTITNAATVSIDNAPAAGTNATITNSYALWVEAGTTRIGGNLAHTGTQAGFFSAPTVVQPSTTGETAGFVVGAGTGVNDDSTFTGNVGTKAYTVGDLVKHLKNLGLVATS